MELLIALQPFKADMTDIQASSAVSHLNVGVLLAANGHLLRQKTAASLIQQ
jgi:hypothetical protein